MTRRRCGSESTGSISPQVTSSAAMEWHRTARRAGGGHGRAEARRPVRRRHRPAVRARRAGPGRPGGCWWKSLRRTRMEKRAPTNTTAAPVTRRSLMPMLKAVPAARVRWARASIRASAPLVPSAATAVATAWAGWPMARGQRAGQTALEDGTEGGDPGGQAPDAEGVADARRHAASFGTDHTQGDLGDGRVGDRRCRDRPRSVRGAGRSTTTWPSRRA